MMKKKQTNKNRQLKSSASERLLENLNQKLGGLTKSEELSAALSMSKKLFNDFKKKTSPTDGVCIFDSSVMPLPEGIRPAVVDTRKLKYRFNDGDVALSFYPISIDTFEVVGQITGISSETPLIVVFQQGKNRLTVETDQYHLFSLNRLEKGKYTLHIKADKQVIGRIHLTL